MNLYDLMSVLDYDTLVAVHVKNKYLKPCCYYVHTFFELLLVEDEDDFINSAKHLIISNIEVCTAKFPDEHESFSALHIDCVLKKEV